MGTHFSWSYPLSFSGIKFYTLPLTRVESANRFFSSASKEVKEVKIVQWNTLSPPDHLPADQTAWPTSRDCSCSDHSEDQRSPSFSTVSRVSIKLNSTVNGPTRLGDVSGHFTKTFNWGGGSDREGEAVSQHRVYVWKEWSTLCVTFRQRDGQELNVGWSKELGARTVYCDRGGQPES